MHFLIGSLLFLCGALASIFVKVETTPSLRRCAHLPNPLVRIQACCGKEGRKA